MSLKLYSFSMVTGVWSCHLLVSYELEPPIFIHHFSKGLLISFIKEQVKFRGCENVH